MVVYTHSTSTRKIKSTVEIFDPYNILRCPDNISNVHYMEVISIVNYFEWDTVHEKILEMYITKFIQSILRVLH